MSEKFLEERWRIEILGKKNNNLEPRLKIQYEMCFVNITRTKIQIYIYTPTNKTGEIIISCKKVMVHRIQVSGYGDYVNKMKNEIANEISSYSKAM